jgi:tetratricopeptide (TPR) repeat protein
VPRRREQLLLAALILPLVGVIPFIHPVQGLFHDWDDFASAGAALAVASAWIAGEVLRGAPRFAWLALALSLGAAVPSLQWLVLQSDLDRGLARVEAFVTEPPERTGTERGETWDFLGIRNFRLERWAAAARAFSHAAETAPSPRILLQWALAEQKAGDLAASLRVYRRAVEKSPNDLTAWTGFASVASQLLDEPASREAAEQMLRIHPGDHNALDLLQSIEDYKKRRATGSPGSPP